MRNLRAVKLLTPFLLLVTLPFSNLFSGSIDPDFGSKMEILGGNELVETMVMMSEEVDLEALDNELIASKATRQVRHERVVRALQEKALRTQAEVRRHLEDAKARGEVTAIRPFWATNAIAVTATVDFIRTLAQRSDVGVIYEDLVIPLDETYKVGEGSGIEPPILSQAEAGLTSMNADSLWRLGYTGNGVLVCNLDTGVHGAHVALSERWRGNEPGVSPQEAWYDPYDNSTFPVDDDGHGTGTMGCITGVDHATGDTIGAAIGATWIAANVFESNITRSSAFTGAFEWAIDPDGDPSTIEDVPDVVSNSWGAPQSNCNTGYWSVIDANRMAGIMVVFSAGNEGPGPQTIGSPASRITSPTNVFAIGATNSNNTIASFSSRGPSECDGQTIKPEVVAHGVNVRTSSRSGGYSSFNSGTSFSAPYVAGGLALLREVAPHATHDEIMEAMMSTAVDLGPVGEDNTYGHGIPDLAAAAEELLLIAPSPRLVFSGSIVNDGNDGIPEAGESFDLEVYIANLGSNTTGVEATLSLVEPDPYVTIESDFSTFGDIDQEMTAGNSSNPFHVTLDPETPGAHVMNFVLDVSADGGAYTRQLTFSLQTPFVISLADHDVGNVRFSVSDGGRFGWDSLDQTEGSGFVFPISNVDHLFEGALLVGYDSVHVSHSARSTPSGPVATDWQLLPGGDIQISEPGTISDEDGHSSYSDTGAEDPIGLDVVQNSYAWSDADYEDFVIVEMTFHNTGIDSSSDIEGLYIGMYMDWDVQPFFGTARNHAAVDTAFDVGYNWSPTGNTHCGVHVLTEPGVVSFDLIDNQAGGYGFSKAEYWQSLSGGIADLSGDNQDWSYVISTGPFDLPAGESVTVAFAVIGGDDLNDLLKNVGAAREIYDQPPVGVGDGLADGGNILPRAFGLSQNYPNPFNPSTTIRYQVPSGMNEGVRVVLEVFDLRGRKIRTLVDRVQEPGNYSVQWNGRGESGENAGSGIYLYRIKAGEYEKTRRMLLVK